MKSIGQGVWELKEADDRTWYRIMYLSKVNDIIHILHCFEKDSRKTDQRDLRIARDRLSKVQQRLLKQKKKSGGIPL